MDGNRIWGGELKPQLCKVQWSPDSKIILFATLTGEIQIYDSQGYYVKRKETVITSLGKFFRLLGQLVVFVWHLSAVTKIKIMEIF